MADESESMRDLVDRHAHQIRAHEQCATPEELEAYVWLRGYNGGSVQDREDVEELSALLASVRAEMRSRAVAACQAVQDEEYAPEWAASECKLRVRALSLAAAIGVGP